MRRKKRRDRRRVGCALASDLIAKRPASPTMFTIPRKNIRIYAVEYTYSIVRVANLRSISIFGHSYALCEYIIVAVVSLLYCSYYFLLY
jgi:hypothetical protein